MSMTMLIQRPLLFMELRPGWMNHKLESRLLEEIPITSDIQMTPPLWQKGTKKPVDESERGE